MTNRLTLTKIALNTSVASLIALSVASAYAQTAATPAAKPTETNLETIVVTGSRIARPDLQSTSPIAIVTAATLKSAGTVNVETFINTLPEVIPSFNAGSNNPGGGLATVDLRGLGTSRTLVLVNGRRFIGSDQSGTVDLNNIPTDLIERVDVVTGGASATYGSDALAGVVNFILKKNFTGLKVTGSVGLSSQGDNAQYNVSTVMGTDFADKRGNVTIYANYSQRDGVFSDSRDFSRVDFFNVAKDNFTNFINSGNFFDGSSRGTAAIASNPGNRNPKLGSGKTLIDGQLCDDAVGKSRTIAFNPDGTARGFCNVLQQFGGDRYNFAPVNYLSVPQKKYQIAAFGNYEINDNIDFFTELTYVNNRVPNQLAPSPLAATNNVTITPDNPLIDPSVKAALLLRADPNAPATLQRRMTDLGPRVQDNNSNLFQATGGLKGKVFGNWNYEVYAQYGRNEVDTIIHNDLSRFRLQAGVNGCPAGSPEGCIPLKEFFGGTLTSAEQAYIRYNTLTDKASIERQVFSGNITGSLLTLPAGDLGVSVGAEYRKESSASNPDAAKQKNDVIGFNRSLPTGGSFTVKEIFGEAHVPILKDVPAIQSLDLDFGGRVSKYSTVGTVYTYKIGGEWSPVGGVRLRSEYQQAVRAPNVFELFEGGDDGNPVVLDPCDTRFFNGDAAVQARCAAAGIDATSFIASNTQITQTSIGNPKLKEEKSKTFTLGLVLNGKAVSGAPSWLKGFSATADYYNIKINNYVNQQFGGAQSLVNACYNDNDPVACSQISRGADGQVIVNFISSVNLQTYLLRGLDFGLNYQFDLPNDMGRIGLTSNWTRTLKYRITDPSRGTADGVGTTGFAGSAGSLYLPKVRGGARVTYAKNGFNTTLAWRYVGPVTLRSDSFAGPDDPTGVVASLVYPDLRVPAFSYFDLSAGYQIGEHLELNFAVTNLANRQARNLYDFATNGNTNPSEYDVIGRYFRMGAAYTF